MSFLTLASEFSRTYCISICAFPVPAILMTTLQSLLFVAFQRRRLSLTLSVGLDVLLTGLMLLHVGTWFIIGVVTPVTFILLTLSLSCFCLNSWLWFRFGQRDLTESFFA